MKRIVLALTFVAAFSAPAFAEQVFYVTKDSSTGQCHILERTKGDQPSAEHGNEHLTLADARAAMAADSTCKK